MGEIVKLRDAKSNNDVSLDDFAADPRWVAWRVEVRNGLLTKIPYDPNRQQQARIPTAPLTWGSYEQAQRRWDNDLSAANSVGGVGIVLGELDDGMMLMGVDLDRCFDPKTDVIRPWALEVINKFATYAEVSPSGKGIKLFFLIAAGDVTAVKALLGKTRRAFVVGKHQEIAIDRARFYAVTGDQLEGVPKTLQVVSVEHVRWFVQEAGPHYLSRFKPKTTDNTAPKPRDESGSGFGLRFFQEHKSARVSYQTARDAILANPGRAGDWARSYDGKQQERQLQRAWEKARYFQQTESEETRPLVLRSIASFERRDLEWTWFPFFPKRMISLLSGDKASGKSSVLLDLAARISRGTELPRFGDDEQQLAPKGSVIILCQEDDIASLIRPRLETAGADLTRIHTLGYEVADDPRELDLIHRLDTTIPKIEPLIKELGDVQLIVVDPITDYTGKGDLNKDTDVRQLLNPLGRLASRYNLAVICIIHFNKKSDQATRYRMLGSVAFRNVSKSSVIVVKNAEAANQYYMAQEASNLTAENRAVSYSMLSLGSYHRIDWGSDYEEVSADELMEDSQPKKKQRAEKLLREWLTNGPVVVDVLEQKAKQAGISWRTMRRVKDKIQVSSRKTARGQWQWALYGD